MNLKIWLQRMELPKIRANTANVIARLRSDAKKRKIKVVFLNCEASKWSYQYIYKQFADDERFEVQVLISVHELLLRNKYSYIDYKQRAKENFEFFKNKNMNVDYAFDLRKGKAIDLRHFSPDIIFYDEPQSVCKVQNILHTSEFAIPLYCSYGSCISNGKNEFPECYKGLFAYFVDNFYTKQFLTEKGFNPSQLIVAGQPKIEAFMHPINLKQKVWRTENKHIIYAPHFSFDANSELRFGTFHKTYDFFYNYAKNHPEYEFIFKPHPSLKREIVKRKLMTIDEANDYYEKWEELENAQIYESGNYFDMFRTSDVLITDCNSFLYEYLLTEKPVIHLINKNSVGHNEYGEKIIAGYYKAKTLDDVNKYLEQILINEDDTTLETRKSIIAKELILPEGGVSKVVFDYVNKMLCKEGVL